MNKMTSFNEGQPGTDTAQIPGSTPVNRLEDFPDASTFLTRKKYPALRIPAKQTATLRKLLGKQLLKIPRMKSVYDDPDNEKEYRILVLASDDALNGPEVTGLVEESKGSITTTNHWIEMPYDYLTVEETLKRILKDHVEEIPSAFEIIGNIAHVNLRDDCLPYKYWIGKAILDKNEPRIRTVVNKVGTIDSVYRTFGMEVIAGFDAEDWSIVTVKEERCKFQLDFQHVYWNSRLAGEHKRLVTHIFESAKKNGKKQTVVADLMGGIGPFAVPLTSHENQNNIRVYANDLNPASYKFLKINAEKNNCRQISCHNEDGRAFVHWLQKEKIPVDHFLMNLPASAPEFLDAFRGYQPLSFDATEATLPWIHVHCFAPKAAEKEDFYQCAVDRCAEALGCAIDRNQDKVNIHVVRDVSPGKNMLCVTFCLPASVVDLRPIIIDLKLKTPSNQIDAADEASSDMPKSKRAKTS